MSPSDSHASLSPAISRPRSPAAESNAAATWQGVGGWPSGQQDEVVRGWLLVGKTFGPSPCMASIPRLPQGTTRLSSPLAHLRQ
jgi:hypothetical protein